MRRDIILSLSLHLIIIAAVMWSSPFAKTRPFDYDQVIKVRAVAMPAGTPPSAGQPVAVSRPVIPKTVAEAPPEIPIDQPTSNKKPFPEKKAKPTQSKPKPNQNANQDKTADTTTATGTADGQTEIDVPSTGVGSPFGGATIDNASFDYPYWFTQTFNKIAGNWRQTIAIDGSVVCVVYFQVLRSGRVVEVAVRESSGVPAFDQTCLNAIERSAPFPPFPREFRDEIIAITLPFKYEPR